MSPLSTPSHCIASAKSLARAPLAKSKSRRTSSPAKRYPPPPLSPPSFFAHALPLREVAIKTYEKYKVKQFERCRTGRYDDVGLHCAEIDLLRRLRHANVVRLFQVVTTPKRIHIVLEHCSRGTLDSVIRAARGGLSEHSARGIFLQLLRGLAHCHQRAVCHRDVKPDNVLVHESGVVKLIDFGVGDLMEKGKRLDMQCGTPAYAAPEIVENKRYSGTGVDVWSLGVVLYVLVVGRHPFSNPNRIEMFRKITKGEFVIPPTVSKGAPSPLFSHPPPEVASLLRGMLTVDPLKRLTFKRIALHEWCALSADEAAAIEEEGGLEVDGTILARMTSLGFDRAAVERSLSRNDFDAASACYRLFEYQKERERAA